MSLRLTRSLDRVTVSSSVRLVRTTSILVTSNDKKEGFFTQILKSGSYGVKCFGTVTKRWDRFPKKVV